MAEEKSYIISIAGKQLACKFMFPDTAVYFNILPYQDHEFPAFCYVRKPEMDFWENTGKTYDAYGEYSMLAVRISDELLHGFSCVFHAVAFLFKGRAWLITAPPGVGKSTQYRYLKQLYPSEFAIICGDKPVLEYTGSSIVVHPSPWNGSEGWHGEESGVLEGIILLSRGGSNSIEKVKPRDSIIPVYRSVIQSAETEHIVEQACGMTDIILKNCQIWKMTTITVPNSTKMLYEKVFSAYE